MTESVHQITVWTDGSGTTGGPAGIGFVAHSDQLKGTIEGSLSLLNATNQQAEILAAAFALQELPEGSDITVVSDSEYVVKGWNDYLEKWRSNGWVKSDRKPVKNQSHWQRLLTAAARHRSVSFEWTRGHVGTEQNERADALASVARKAGMGEA